MNTQINLELNEIEIIKKSVLKIFNKCEIYIFGSRLKRKGGDVDIYLIPENKENLFEKVIEAKVILKDKLLRNVDIIIHKDFNNLIEKNALKGIKL